MALEVVYNFIKICRNLNPTLDTDACLIALSDNAQENYHQFSRFIEQCFNTMLSIMHRLGHCACDQRLIDIIYEVILLRDYLNYEEEDTGGHIATFRRAVAQPGKNNFYYLKVKIIKNQYSIINYNKILIF